MTANFQAEKSIKIQKEIDDGFLKLSEDKLAGKLKELGHRFPNMRAKFIVEARKHIPEMMKLLAHGNEEGNEGKEKTEKEKREWLAKNIKGLGMKEASHFLRNVGYKNLAILDFHIIDILAEHKIIEPVDKLTPRTYIEIENKLEELCKKTGLYQGELDFYLWFLETGKVLK
jgi:N-glycosylase/DNA lyase